MVTVPQTNYFQNGFLANWVRVNSPAWSYSQTFSLLIVAIIMARPGNKANVSHKVYV